MRIAFRNRSSQIKGALRITVGTAEQNEQLQPTNTLNNYSEKMVHQQQNNNGILSQFGINLNGESIKDKCIRNIKYPILIFIISFIFGIIYY